MSDQTEDDYCARLHHLEAKNGELEERLARIEAALVLGAGALGALAAQLPGVDVAAWPKLVGLP